MNRVVTEGAARRTSDAKQTAWSPLRYPLFRNLWLAAVASNVGTWMHNVGADWLMTTLAPSPFMVALMQTAQTAPVFLLALPAGALADIVDRRRLLLFTQAWMLVSAVALGVLTLLGLTTPWSLLLLTFMLGLGSAMNAPAWQAIVPELVPRKELPLAISLNSVAFNIARAVGPAIGGLLVAAIGSWAVFLLNSASFGGILFVIYRWQREPSVSISPAERVSGAIRAGIRYVRYSPDLKRVLFRTAIFTSCASALWAMLPLVARQELGLSAVGYGILLGGLGAGAIVAAFLLPGIRQRVAVDTLIPICTLVFAAVTLVLARVDNVIALVTAMFFGGIAWMTLMSSFNITVQTLVPEWVRARALSIYLLTFFGTLAGGSMVWGTVASRVGIRAALSMAAGGLVLGLLGRLLLPIRIGRELDLSPSLHWTDPVVISEFNLDRGPVLVIVEYIIDPARAADFTKAMQALGRILKRDGASLWGVFQDTARRGCYVETFLVESWAEHLRQHARVTKEDKAIQDLVRSFHIGDGPPRVTHLIAADFASRRRGFLSGFRNGKQKAKQILVGLKRS